MAKYEAKTKPESRSVTDFLSDVPNEQRRQDAHALIEIYQDVTGFPPVLWGPSIVGFDSYHYKYASGHQGTAAAAGFSPRAANLTIYFAEGFDSYSESLAALGPHKLGKSCLYVKKLADVDLTVLRSLLAQSYERVKNADWAGGN